MDYRSLNTALLAADEAECLEMLEAEKAGACRVFALLRIQSRINKLRIPRERAELRAFAAAITKGKRKRG